MKFDILSLYVCRWDGIGKVTYFYRALDKKFISHH